MSESEARRKADELVRTRRHVFLRTAGYEWVVKAGFLLRTRVTTLRQRKRKKKK